MVFIENLDEYKKKYLVYDQEFYVIFQEIKKCRNYLFPKEFVLFTDHQALRYLNTRAKINQRHMKWEKFMQSYNFVLNHKSWKTNKVVDSLSWRFTLLGMTVTNSTGLELMKDDYEIDRDFVGAWRSSKELWRKDRTSYLDYFI